MLLNTLLALFAVIVVAIAVSMFLDDNTLSYFRNKDLVPVLNTNDLTLGSNQEFFINTQISDDMPYNY